MTKKLENTSAYEAVGASASKAGLHRALSHVGLEDSAGLFVRTNSDAARDSNYLSALHCDGAGTKTIVSYLNYRETNNPSWFSGLAQDALVMNLDDMYCAGAPEYMLLSNAIARNARLIPDTALEAILASYLSLCSLLREHGIEIEFGGGETADCGDIVRTLVVDAVLFGRLKKSQIVRPERIIPGDVILALSSSGTCTYESTPNSGIGSNGLTLARHALLKSSYQESFPEVVDQGVARSATYRGPFLLQDSPAELGMTIGAALQSPTRTFAPLLHVLHHRLKDSLHGLIHVTGGGLTKVLRFGKGNCYIKNHLLPCPPIFKLIQQHGQVSWREMYQVFNMGQRMELYVPESAVPEIEKEAKHFGIESKVIGHVEKQKSASTLQNSVRVESEHGLFEYTLENS